MRLYLGSLCLVNVILLSCYHIIEGIDTLDEIIRALKLCLFWSVIYSLVCLGSWCVTPYLERL